MTPNDKRYPAYQIACAKLTGEYLTAIPIMRIMYGGPDQQIGIRESQPDELPTYLDHASIKSVVKKLDDSQCWKYHNALVSMFDASKGQPAYVKLHRATEEQESEALCRTLVEKEK